MAASSKFPAEIVTRVPSNANIVKIEYDRPQHNMSTDQIRELVLHCHTTYQKFRLFLTESDAKAAIETTYESYLRRGFFPKLLREVASDHAPMNLIMQMFELRQSVDAGAVREDVADMTALHYVAAQRAKNQTTTF